MKQLFILCACVVLFCCEIGRAQAPAPLAAPPSPTPEEPEQRALSQSLQEAGNSPVDFVRALEQHLTAYPTSKDRDKIERALVRAAIEAKDDRRIVQYGERVLVKEPKDVQILEKVAAALLVRDDRESAEKAAGYAHTLEGELLAMRNQKAPENYSLSRWQSQIDRRLATALKLEAQAQGDLGKTGDAIALAKRGWETYPTAAGAREWARWLVREGKPLDAVAHYADAFTLEDPDSTEEDRARDRMKMGELYTKKTGSEKGLGDIILQAYDRTTAMMSVQVAKSREGDPNSQAKVVLDFTLPAVQGDSLKLQSLKGKTVVLDFWATWCGPCRAQRPLYDQVEKKYAANPNVVFLSVNTDEDRTAVAPFLAAQKWDQHVYFDAGLGGMLRVNSIPTTIVLDREGQIFSRMAGFVPDRFVDMLTSRIEETLHGQ